MTAGKSKTVVKDVVATRTNDYNKISMGSIEVDGKTGLFITIEDGGGNANFHFDSPHELRLFVKRIDTALDGYI